MQCRQRLRPDPQRRSVILTANRHPEAIVMRQGRFSSTTAGSPRRPTAGASPTSSRGRAGHARGAADRARGRRDRLHRAGRSRGRFWRQRPGRARAKLAGPSADRCAPGALGHANHFNGHDLGEGIGEAVGEVIPSMIGDIVCGAIGAAFSGDTGLAAERLDKQIESRSSRAPTRWKRAPRAVPADGNWTGSTTRWSPAGRTASPWS